MDDELLQLDATAQLQLLERRRVGARELLELAVARAHAVADSVNAVVAADLGPARAAARWVDDRRAALAKVGGDPSEELGLLGGLPMTISDMLDVDGLPAAAGSLRRSERTCSDADAVGRARAAGAVVWGKTHAPRDPEAAATVSRPYGRTGNPWDPARSAGGGAGGAAAAIACEVSALEAGVDAPGGLRTSAAACGVFAHRPTAGLVSQRGRTPPPPGAFAEPDMAALGPMARSARDLRLLLAVLAPAALPARAGPAILPGLRVGLWLEADAFPLEPSARAATERWACALAALGARVEEALPPAPPGPLLRAFHALQGAERARGFTAAGYRARRALRPAARTLALVGDTPSAWAARVLAETASHRDWMRADETRARLRARMAALFEVWDVVICPAATGPAAPDTGRDRTRLDPWSAFAAVLGLPATCMPAGFAHGLPVGVQIVGPAGADSRTLAVAQACEAEIGGFVAPPPALARASPSAPPRRAEAA